MALAIALVLILRRPPGRHQGEAASFAPGETQPNG
jgi:hypothetical protein